jgi:metallophosphoesterase superfamily enzyme
LVVLGDLIHSSVKASADYQDDLKNWRGLHKDLPIRLVRGNHDRHNRLFIESMKLDSVEEGNELGPFVLVHNSQTYHLTHPDQFILSGHIHPSVRLRDRSMSGMKVACFWQKSNELVFPAFGEFTGTAMISPAREDTVYPLAGECIFKICGSNCC